MSANPDQQHQGHQHPLPRRVPQTLGMPRRPKSATLAVPPRRVEAQQVCLRQPGTPITSSSHVRLTFRTIPLTLCRNSRRRFPTSPQTMSPFTCDHRRSSPTCESVLATASPSSPGRKTRSNKDSVCVCVKGNIGTKVWNKLCVHLLMKSKLVDYEALRQRSPPPCLNALLAPSILPLAILKLVRWAFFFLLGCIACGRGDPDGFVWGARMRRCTAYMTDNIGQTAAVTLEQHYPSYSRNSHGTQKSLWRPASNVLYDHSCTNPPRASPRTRTYGSYVGCSADHVMCLPSPFNNHRF